MTWTSWLIIAVVLIIFEIATPSIFFFICLAVGSVFAALAAYFGISSWIGFVIFIVTSILSLYLIRPIFKKMINKSETVNSNIDVLIGMVAVVTERITPSKIGFVKVLSEIWRAESDVELEVGEIVKIKKIDGTTLTVKK
ncbi:NfeD family protein [Candidatus Endomicrobiellum agilis]|jgi:membrane protein implicated in regulation of membrane protease activity|uniref:NfeD family protein n=1 Tax=Candidatus Endomicrobiellum agilis TaxID=3238957 RepID=UPI002845BA83|nr:NfeD family protein [Endomicrobium sp.]MDR3092368.1 NfeD family protein [Endomicrobium sp.]